MDPYQYISIDNINHRQQNEYKDSLKQQRHVPRISLSPRHRLHWRVGLVLGESLGVASSWRRRPTSSSIVSQLLCALQIEPRFSNFAKKTLENLIDFLETECLPAEHLYHAQIPHDPVQRWKVIPPVIEELKRKAKSRGLWNLFLSKLHYPEHGVDLTNLEVSDDVSPGLRACSQLTSLSLARTGSTPSWPRSWATLL